MRAREALCRSSVFGDDLWKVLPVTRDGLSRLGDVRQRARVPGDERPLAAPRDPDDDPRAVAEARVDEPRAAGLLRVPLLADGALGRPGVDRVHRRDGHRRRCSTGTASGPRATTSPRTAWSSWPPRSACSTSRRRTCSSRSACIPAGSSWSTRRRAGSSTTRRSRASWRRRAPLRRVAPGEHRSTWPICPAQALPDAGSRHGAPAADRVRLHARGPPDPPGAHGEERRGAARLDGHRHRARGALEPPAAALRLLQAAVRPGHEPSAGPDPRGARDVDGVDDRPGGEPPRGRRPSRAARS